jgi:hypothetical protein
MVANILYESESEKRQHLSAMYLLSSTFGLTENSVKQLYENELQSLVGRARVRDFLSVIVIRRLKEKLRDNST